MAHTDAVDSRIDRQLTMQHALGMMPAVGGAACIYFIVAGHTHVCESNVT